MSNNFRITMTTPAGSAAVVCPRALSVRPRYFDGFAAAHQVKGPQSWSPPIT